MTKSAQNQPFSKWRSLLWPVHAHELKKLIPMLLIFFLLSFDYNVLRTIKDTLIVTARDSGPEAIPFIKVWVMFPTSLLLTWVFLKLSNRFDRERVFYIVLGGFLSFFFLFAFVLYPNNDLFTPNKLVSWLSSHLPSGCKGFVSMVKYWNFTLFYVMSELWGTVIMFLLFWGFANQVTKLEEARRFYGLFGVGINISGVAAGSFSIGLTNFIKTHSAIDSWGITLFWLNATVIVSGLLAMFFFGRLNKILRRHPELGNTADTPLVKKKMKLSMRENIRYLLSERYILFLVGVVVSYNVVINLVELLWKNEVRTLFPNSADYNLFMNQVTVGIGILATFASFFISGNFLRAFGWTKTALITPIILFLTSIGFFGCFFLKGYGPQTLIAGVSPLVLTVFFGTVQNCLSRASKYTVFDETKEIVFIPLSQEEKLKGKAAIDGICNRLGKSVGSVVYQVLFLFCSTITASAPYVAIILFSVIAVWVFSAINLGTLFNERSRQMGEPDPSEKPQEQSALAS